MMAGACYAVACSGLSSSLCMAASRSNWDRHPATPRDEVGDLLAGKRVLLVEDEFFVAVEIEDALHLFGCETSGPYTTLDLAIQASRREEIDVAILDINLNGRAVYPLADELQARGIPFVFLTGYASSDLPEAYRSLPRLQKPFDPAAVKSLLEKVLSAPDA